MSTWSGNVAVAQFSSDRVLIYVKAGQEPSKARDVIVIGYFADRDEILNRCADAEDIRKTASAYLTYFKSPYKLFNKSYPMPICRYFDPEICQYNSSVSTSKYRVYSGYRPSGGNCWGTWDARTINWAFSKDGQQMIFWVSEEENKRETYLLTDLSEFDPSTSSSSNYDFLE